jgi:hypothetical protein
MAKESDSEKETKMMGRNKGYPRRIEVLSLRDRGTEFISSPTRSKTAAQAALMKWQDAKKGENDKVNMRRERNVRNENSEKAGESKKKKKIGLKRSKHFARCKMDGCCITAPVMIEATKRNERTEPSSLRLWDDRFLPLEDTASTRLASWFLILLAASISAAGAWVGFSVSHVFVFVDPETMR